MKPKIVKVYYDLETTGLDHRRHGIHQLAGIIELNGEEVARFNYKVQPNPKAQIQPEALKIARITEDDFVNYTPMKQVYKAFLRLLSTYIDRFDKTDKAWLIGFNNRGFDDKFLRAWFQQNNDTFFGSWFWSDSLDAMVLASEYLIERRSKMKSFKLHRVAKELGIDVDDTQLHDGLYDVELTRQIYLIVTGREIEL